jgi:hypothetical protein
VYQGIMEKFSISLWSSHAKILKKCLNDALPLRGILHTPYELQPKNDLVRNASANA